MTTYGIIYVVTNTINGKQHSLETIEKRRQTLMGHPTAQKTRDKIRDAQRDSDAVYVQVVDFFSGAGGMSHGFATAAHPRLRYEIKGAIEIDPHANATYERMLGVAPTERDVRELLRPAALADCVARWRLDRARPFLLIGCAPCQGFSSHRKKDARVDPRDSLVEVFGRIATQLRPDVVVMENVPELLQDRHWNHFQVWRRALEGAGYHVRVQIHNVAEYGVPQERFRTLAIAARDWRHFDLPAPTHTPERFRTVREAIGHLPPLAAGDADPRDPMHVTSHHRAATVELLRLIPPDGGSRRALPADVVRDCHRRVDGFRDVYGRLAWDKPSVSITARCRTPSCGRFTHPEQHRGLSVREAALLQGFPKDYVFDGPFDDKFKQIGNAVSPTFARAVATHLAEEWFRGHGLERREQALDRDVTSPIRKSFSSSIAGIKRRAQRAADTQVRMW